MLQKRFNDLHDIKIFSSAHLSFYMGAGAKFRLLDPSDFSGKKIRSMGPAENAMLSAFGANPTTMAFGDVPPALETGVIDGLLTSLGGFNRVKDTAPFYTIAGINGIVGDYYWIGASNKWWNKLDADQQKIISQECAVSSIKQCMAPAMRHRIGSTRTWSSWKTLDSMEESPHHAYFTTAAAIYE